MLLPLVVHPKGTRTKTERLRSPQQMLESFSNNGFAVAIEPDSGLWGYIDKNGKWVIEPKFTYANDFYLLEDVRVDVGGATTGGCGLSPLGGGNT